jgi:hypothetical protein
LLNSKIGTALKIGADSKIEIVVNGIAMMRLNGINHVEK